MVKYGVLVRQLSDLYYALLRSGYEPNIILKKSSWKW